MNITIYEHPMIHYCYDYENYDDGITCEWTSHRELEKSSEEKCECGICSNKYWYVDKDGSLNFNGISPEEVVELECSSNKKIKSLPTSLINLKKLKCFDTLLTEIPDLPECLELVCFSSPINKIGNLPKCKKLLCYKTDIESFLNIDSIVFLNCDSTKIKFLPDLLKCTELLCDFTNIKSLPKLPSIKYLECDKIYDKWSEDPFVNAKNYLEYV